MKKTLGLLALTLAVSGIASADQDYIKNLNVTSEFRQGYIDKDGSKANEIGWTGFKGANRDRTRWRNIVSGTLVLNDEAGAELNFFARNDSDKYRRGNNASINRRDSDWETKLEFAKKWDIGSLDTTWKLGWNYNSNARKSDGVSENFTTRGRSNVFYFGPTVKYNLLGHEIENDIQVLYFNNKGVESADYIYTNTDGWGANFNVRTGKDLLAGSFGTWNYYLELNNKFRDGNRPGEETNVYLDYIVGTTYTTPSFWGGFYGQANLENEWEKHTAVNGYYNTASAWLRAGYKTSLDTSVGSISINPYVAYKPWSRETAKNNSGRKTIEYNEWRAGLKLGLTVK